MISSAALVAAFPSARARGLWVEQKPLMSDLVRAVCCRLATKSANPTIEASLGLTFREIFEFYLTERAIFLVAQGSAGVRVMPVRCSANDVDGEFIGWRRRQRWRERGRPMTGSKTAAVDLVRPPTELHQGHMTMRVAMLSEHQRAADPALFANPWQPIEVQLRRDKAAFMDVLRESPAPKAVIVDEAQLQSKLLLRIKRYCPHARLIILTSTPLSVKVAEAYADGYDPVSVCRATTDAAFKQELCQALFQRRQVRKRCDRLVVQFRRDRDDGTVAEAGQPCSFPVHDISSGGLAWHVPDTALDARHCKGAVHALRAVLRDGLPLLGPARVEIRYVHRCNHTSPRKSGHLVGARFLPLQPDPGAVIEDPTRLLALLRSAAQSSTLRMSTPHSVSVVMATKFWPELSGEAACLCAEVSYPSSWNRGDVLHCSFDQAESTYEFYVSIVALPDDGPLRLSFPTASRPVRPRTAPRARLSSDTGPILEFEDPFTQRTHQAEVLDLSSYGLAFRLPNTNVCLPIGCRIERMTLRIDGQPLVCAGTVRAHRRGDLGAGTEGGTCFGVELQDLPQQHAHHTARAAVKAALPEVELASELDAEELWSFFVASNFLYPDKMRKIEAILPEVKGNFSRMMRKSASLVTASIVAKNPATQKLDAYISLMRVYHGTWMLHHLASLGMKSGNRYAARNVFWGATCVMSNLRQLSWVRIYFQPHKAFLARSTGDFALNVGAGHDVCISQYAYLTASSCDEEVVERPGVNLRPATDSDLRLLERKMTEEGCAAEFLADELRDDLSLKRADFLYRKLGLWREREAMVAEVNGECQAIALLEFAPYGLNLSEVTNRCSIHAWGSEDQSIPALARYARRRYAERGYNLCILMVRDRHRSLVEAAGFRYSRQYSCFTLHRDLAPRYGVHLRRTLSVH
ncbi:MAG: hypothetical protein ACPGUV_03725 [Polyangiales bacterium]